MKLDRNLNADGQGKYALYDLRKQAWVNDCGVGQEHEFFVIMLKDVNASAALIAYAQAIRPADPEFAREVMDLVSRAGSNSDFCQDPD